LRFTIWRALESYTATRWNTRGHDAKGRSARERFAFYCMRNQIKDLLKARGRRDSAKPDWMGDSITGVREVYLEDAASDRAGDAHGSFRDRFEGKYLAQRPGDRHEDEVMLPATLTGDERQVVVLLYLDFSQAEIARLLSVSRPGRPAGTLRPDRSRGGRALDAQRGTAVRSGGPLLRQASETSLSSWISPPP
jgi:DNA-directed RNA polymerase specialized sigma24 family protein